jgi:hypothetical protein
MPEQRRIVAYLDGLAEPVAALAQHRLQRGKPQSKIAADPPSLMLRRTSLDALLPSVLDKAFKGEL